MGSPMNLLRPLNDAPLISFVLINWNYGRFVRRAIASIRNQDYKNFECLVIDNASSDDSRQVIQEEIKDDHRFTPLLLDENLNQMGALLHVLPRLQGQLVNICDADDILFENFASYHSQVHLGAQYPIGFSSSGVLECDEDGQILTGRFDPFEGFPRLKTKLILRKDAARISELADSDYESLGDAVLQVPETQMSWVWSPGTSNVYRKEMLELCRPAEAPRIYVAAVDNYYAPFINAMASSALITKPLSGYRFHGSNRFATSPSMLGLRAMTRSGRERSINRRRDIITTLCSDPARYLEVLGERFWSVIDLPSSVDCVDRVESFESERIQKDIEKNFAKLHATFGDDLRDRLSERMNRETVARLWKRCWKILDEHNSTIKQT